jgi:hypothetical protein
MPATSRQTLVLRRAPADDPLAAGYYDATLAFTHCAFVPVVVGNATQSGGGRLYGRTTKRGRIDIDLLGFRRGADSESAQSYGRYLRLVDHVLTGPEGSTLWLWRVYEAGSSTNAPALRDNYVRSTPAVDTTSASTLWNLSDVAYQVGPETYPYSPAGILPLEVVLTDQAEASHEGGGLYALSLTLWAADTYTTAI